MPSQLFISLPHSDSYQVFTESASGSHAFRFVSFDKKQALDLRMQPAVEEGCVPHYRPAKEVPPIPLREKYLDLIERSIMHLREKNLGKIVLSRPHLLPNPPAPLVLFKKMVKAYPTACVYLFSHPATGTWLGATPETLLKKHGNAVTTMSLAGTRPLGQEGSFTAKEQTEQQMVTDFITEIFNQETGLSEVEVSPPEASPAGNLVHFKSSISAQASPRFSPKGLLEKLHPTPAVAGFPKREALNFIAAHEGYQRAFYAGYFGLGQKDNFHYFVNLRCMQFFDKQAVLYAGGGITADSDPVQEWEETEAKLRTLLNVVESPS